MLSSSDKEFLGRRKHFADTWRPVAIGMLLCLAALLVWLFITAPYMVNPLLATTAVQSGSLSHNISTMAAVMLPIMTLICFGICVMVIYFGFIVFANERRYMAIIEKLQGNLTLLDDRER